MHRRYSFTVEEDFLPVNRDLKQAIEDQLEAADIAPLPSITPMVVHSIVNGSREELEATLWTVTFSYLPEDHIPYIRYALQSLGMIQIVCEAKSNAEDASDYDSFDPQEQSFCDDSEGESSYTTF